MDMIPEFSAGAKGFWKRVPLGDWAGVPVFRYLFG